MKRLICGLLAHVDAGKTTLSESLLFLSGELRKAGRVDHGDCFLDTDAQERERGITIFSKQARLSWKNTEIVLLDTPGHTDFSGETERTLQVMDMAVLLISASDGVQGHTLTLWKLLRHYHVPTVIFVNKMDQPDTDRKRLSGQLKMQLSDGVIDLEDQDAEDELAMCSENALQEYLEHGCISEAHKHSLFAEEKLFPVLFGAALRHDGVRELLDFLDAYAVSKTYPDEFGARVYKIGRDNQGNRLTYMKITGGVLRAKDTVLGDQKINQIRLYSGAKYTMADQITAGGICAVTGPETTRTGQGLGIETDAESPVLQPVFTYRIIPEPGIDNHTALRNLQILEEEDPELHVVWNTTLHELHVQLMGEVQLEILSRLLLDRFGMSVSFGAGSILYRETIASPAEGVGHYEPLRHYAEVHLLLEPGEKGCGLKFSSNVSEDVLDRNWQRLILTHLNEKQHLGVLTGSPLTDVKITLTAGRAHLKHTEGGDFRQATYRAVRNGLMYAKSVLLEPWYELKLQIPKECVGRAMNDITQMGGTMDPPLPMGGETLISGFAPAARAAHYASDVIAYTKGKGHLTAVFSDYRPCPEQDRIVERFGYDPVRDLDNSPDSIFCAHGAGFPVPWDQVKDYMHLDTGFGHEHAEDAPETRRRVTAYHGTLEEDAELLRIYENTYGKIKPRGFDPVKKTVAPEVKRVEIDLDEPEYLIVDGYNVIFSWEELKKRAQISLDSARDALMEILCNYQGVTKSRIILVFDAYRVKPNAGKSEAYKNITVTYTKEAETADNYIEKTTFKTEGKYRIRVVTSDGLEQIITMGNGALRTSSREFLKEVENANIEIRKILDRNNSIVSGAPRVGVALDSAVRKAIEERKS